jgi:hypothetical protein
MIEHAIALDYPDYQDIRSKLYSSNPDFGVHKFFHHAEPHKLECRSHPCRFSRRPSDVSLAGCPVAAAAAFL